MSVRSLCEALRIHREKGATELKKALGEAIGIAIMICATLLIIGLTYKFLTWVFSS